MTAGPSASVQLSRWQARTLLSPISVLGGTGAQTGSLLSFYLVLRAGSLVGLLRRCCGWHPDQGCAFG